MKDAILIFFDAIIYTLLIVVTIKSISSINSYIIIPKFLWLVPIILGFVKFSNTYDYEYCILSTILLIYFVILIYYIIELIFRVKRGYLYTFLVSIKNPNVLRDILDIEFEKYEVRSLNIFSTDINLSKLYDESHVFDNDKSVYEIEFNFEFGTYNKKEIIKVINAIEEIEGVISVNKKGDRNESSNKKGRKRNL